MSKFNYEIFAKVTLEEEGTGIEEVIFIPISPKDYFEVSDKLQGKNMKVKEIYTNCDISTESLQEKHIDGLDFCSMLIHPIQDLNVLSNKDEVQALTEYLTTDIEEIVKFVMKGNFHFYPDLTFEDVIGDDLITFLGDIDSDIDYGDEPIEYYNANGYFEASTGIIYIPEKSTK